MIIAIDGRCASGKTTLGRELAKKLDCNIIHMDHFFLRPEQRTAERMAKPGANIDYERFLGEVLPHLKAGAAFSYRPFDCQKQEMGEEIFIKAHDACIVEGSYSCHPELFDNYDLRIFLSISADEQMARIIRRDGEEYAAVFREKWIPMEEKYFDVFQIKERCDLVFDTE
ncbi:MAG: uridine kinase [Defluviitaleaceae bacterium]|nr:uridine kinase [Defluviitaleaceae bacterium]